MRNLILTAALLCAFPVLARAQNPDSQYHWQAYFIPFADAPAKLSLQIAGSAPKELPTNTNAHQFGAGGELLDNGVGVGGEILSSTQPFEGSSLRTWIGSVDLSYHFGASTKRRKVEPFLTGGYTFYYVSNVGLSHEDGGNFGGGVNFWLSRLAALRLEVRDDIGGQFLSVEFQSLGNYFLRSSRHLVGFRIGVTFR